MSKIQTISALIAFSIGLACPSVDAQDDSSSIRIAAESTQPTPKSRGMIHAVGFHQVPENGSRQNANMTRAASTRGTTDSQKVVIKAAPPVVNSDSAGPIQLTADQANPRFGQSPGQIASPLRAMNIQQSVRPGSEKNTDQAKPSVFEFPGVAPAQRQKLPPVVKATPRQQDTRTTTVTKNHSGNLKTNRGVRPRHLMSRPTGNVSGRPLPMNAAPRNTIPGQTRLFPQQPRYDKNVASIPRNANSDKEAQLTGLTSDPENNRVPVIVQPDQLADQDQIGHELSLNEIPPSPYQGTPIDRKPIFGRPASLAQQRPSGVDTEDRVLRPEPNMKVEREALFGKGLWMGRNRFNDSSRPASYFEQDPVELGKDTPRYSGVAAFGDDGTYIDGSAGCNCDGQGGPCSSPRCQYDVNSVTQAFGSCGYIARARQMFSAEAVYGFLDSETINGSSVFGLDGYEGSIGGRVNYIQKTGVWGNEFTYLGFETWTAGNQVPQGGGAYPFAGMNALFLPPGFPPGPSFPFSDATFQSQSGKARFHTVEFNRSYWFWDVAKTEIGLRYTYFEDRYRLTSLRGAARGDFMLEAENHIVGPHIGAELFYDVGRRFAFSVSGQIGGGVNAFPSEINGTAFGLPFFNAEDNETDFAWNFAVNASSHWKLGPCSRLVFGYELLGFSGVNNTPNMLIGGFLPTTSVDYQNDNEIYLNSFSFGFEAFR